jgi:hypothetical protein
MMRKLGILAVALAPMLAASAAGAAPPLDCQSCNRPDLPDVNALFHVFVDSVQFDLAQHYTVDGTSTAALHLGDETIAPYAIASRSMGGYRSDGNRYIFERLFWVIFEPDKLQRSAGKSSLSQKDHVGVGVLHYSLSYGMPYTTLYSASPVEGCSASVSLDQKKQQMESKFQCLPLGPLLDAVGLASNSLSRLFLPLVLEMPLDKKVKFSAKGPVHP